MPKGKPKRVFKMGAGKICGARTRSKDSNGAPCKFAAGWGTNHPGLGKCKFHGGSTPSNIAAAGKEALEIFMGKELAISPFEALMWCIRITAGEIEYLSHKIAEIDIQNESEQIELNAINTRQLNVWVRERTMKMGELARFSKMAIDAGIAERQIRLAEMYADTLYRLIRGILDSLELTPEQRKREPEIVRKQLELAMAQPELPPARVINGRAIRVDAPNAANV